MDINIAYKWSQQGNGDIRKSLVKAKHALAIFQTPQRHITVRLTARQFYQFRRKLSAAKLEN